VNEQPCGRVGGRELAFFGQVGAGVSHDIRNVLSIIGESAGLLDDLLAAAQRGKPLDAERLQRISASIARQVKNGTATMERFSRFAHATDEQSGPVDLAALADNMASLLQRHARLAGCDLRAELPARPVLVRADPFRLQHALFLAVRLVLQHVENGAAATIKLVANKPAAVLSVSGKAAADGPALPAPGPGLSEVLEEIDAAVQATQQDGVVSLTITIPMK